MKAAAKAARTKRGRVRAFRLRHNNTCDNMTLVFCMWNI